MAAERRVTRSSKADIPSHQPLPPRREPPKKKKSTNSKQSESETALGNKDRSIESDPTKDPQDDPRPRPVPKLKVSSKQSTQPETQDDINSMFISTRAGFHAISPRPSATSVASSVPSAFANHAQALPESHAASTTEPVPSAVTSQDRLPDHVTYVTHRGFTIQRSITDQEGSATGGGSQRPMAQYRESTPAADFRDIDDNAQHSNKEVVGELDRNGSHEQEAECDDSLPRGRGGGGYESSSSGSDYEEAEVERKRRYAYRKTLCRPPTPTIEEQDSEDDHEFENVAPTPPSSPPRIPASKKGKGRAVNPNAQFHEEHEGHDINEDSGNEDEDAALFSSGPIPEASKQRAQEAHQRFLEELQEIARECNKPVKHFRAMVGLDLKPTRRMRAWDVYQKWYTAEVEPKPKDVTPAEWSKYVSQKYRKEMETLQEATGDEQPTRSQIEEHFKVQFDFARNAIKNYLTEKQNSNTFSGVISKITEPFIRMSMNVAEEFGIHIFGFAVETSPDSCSSVAWGGSEEYKYLRATHKTVIQTQLRDYEGMFKIAEMRERGLASIKSLVTLGRKHGENERDHYRRLLGEFFRSDLARIQGQRDKSPQDESKHKMNWSWTDFAFKHQLRIVGWAKKTSYPKEQFLVKSLKQGPLKLMVKPRMAILESSLKDTEDASDIEDDLASNIVHIESWTEEEISMSLSAQRSIPIVVDVDGTALSTLFDSKAYIACLQKIGQLTPSTRLDDLQESDDEELPTKKKPQQKKNRKKRARDVLEKDLVGGDSAEEDTSGRQQQSTSAHSHRSRAPPAPRFVNVSSDAELDDPQDLGKPTSTVTKASNTNSEQPRLPKRTTTATPLVGSSKSNHDPVQHAVPASLTNNSQSSEPPRRVLSNQVTHQPANVPTTGQRRTTPIPPNIQPSTHPAKAYPQAETFRQQSYPPEDVQGESVPPHRAQLYHERRHPVNPYPHNPPHGDYPATNQPHFWGRNMSGPPGTGGMYHGAPPAIYHDSGQQHDSSEDPRAMKRRRLDDHLHGGASGSRHVYARAPGNWDENQPPYDWPAQDRYAHYPYDGGRPHGVDNSMIHHYRDGNDHSKRPHSPNPYYRDSYY